METAIVLEEGGIQGMKNLQANIFRTFQTQSVISLEQGLAYYAKIKTLQRAVEAVIKDMDKLLIPVFETNGEINTQVAKGDHLFLVQDKKSYNYEGNDDDGLWRMKQQQIDALMAEKKVLTKEQSVIEERIRFEHPNMRVEHNYVLVYKGNINDSRLQVEQV